MVTKELELRFWHEETLRGNKLPINPLFNLNSVFEEHHIFGKSNSNKTALINKERHDFITNRLNLLPIKCRKDKTVIFWSNVASTLELMAFEIRHFIFLYTHSQNEEANEFTLSRGYHQKFIDKIILSIWRKIENGKQRNNG
ncbi:MAG: hypothetical protein WCV90_07265 [Candidatus Woesearchaeota archaeon]|jgi:hypothetical protein